MRTARFGSRRSGRAAKTEGVTGPARNEPPVREESHLEDMRAAIRGDFERLARRRGGQELMQEPSRAKDEGVEPEAPPVELSEATLPDEEPDVAVQAEEPGEQPKRRGFLAWLFGNSL